MSTQVSAFKNTESALIIHQNTINRFFASIGPIQGSSEIHTSPFKTQVDWKVTRPTINILKDQVQFTADVYIQTQDGLSYTSKAIGEATLNYNPTQNIITAKIKKASFELALNLLGNKLKLTDIDITKYYKQDFNFPVPIPSNNIVTLTMPNSEVKRFEIQGKNRKLSLEPQEIIISSHWEFIEIPSTNPQ